MPTPSPEPPDPEDRPPGLLPPDLRRDFGENELDGGGPNRPEPARDGIGWIFSDFQENLENKKGFGEILLAKSSARASQGSKPY